MRIYYINLDRRTDRRSEMDAQFSHLGLAANRIAAVTPADVSEMHKRLYCDPRKTHWMTEPELACSLSHLKALDTFLSTSARSALILEDDVRLSASLPNFLEAVDNAPTQQDILRIETYLDRQRLMPLPETSILDVHIFRAWSWCAGAAGYIVNRHAAQVILESKEFLRLQTDGAMFNPYEPLSRVLTVRHCVPGLAVQLDRLDATRRDSDLHMARQRHKQPRPIPQPQRLIRTLAGVAKTEILWGSQRQFHTLFGGARKVFVPFKAD